MSPPTGLPEPDEETTANLPVTHRAFGAVWWSALEIASRYGVQFALTVVLARLLAPRDFGLLAMLLVFTAVGALLVDSGFGTALIQKQQPSRDDETTVFFVTIIASVCVGIFAWLSAPAVSVFYGQPELIPLLRFMVLVFPFGALAAVPDALLTIKLDFKSRTQAEVVASLCSGAVAVILAWQGFGVWSLAWQAITTACVRCLLLWWYSRWIPRGRFNRRSFRSLFRFGGYMLMANLLNTIYVRSQSLLIGKLFTSDALGYYSLAQSTQQAPTYFVSGVLNRVGLPVFATLAAQPERLVSALRSSLRVSLFVFFPCMVGLAAVAKPLVHLLYGEKWAPAAQILSILALSSALWPLHVLNLAAISAQGKSKLVFDLEVIKRIVSIALIFICSFHGPIAVAWAVFISSIFAVAINTSYTKKILGYGVLTQLKDQFPTLILTILSVAVAWLIVEWMPKGTIASATAIVAATAVYSACAFLGHLAAVEEIARFLKQSMAVIDRSASLGRGTKT